MEILIERALEFFPSNRQAMMRLRFGIGDSPQMTVGEIAEELNINVASVSAAFSRDKEILAELVTSLSTNSLDYDDLRTRGQFSGRNVITMFHLLGVPLPKEAHLQELRGRASWHLGKIIESERDRQVVCELYGLGDSSQDRTHKEIAAKFGMSKQNVQVVEARVLKQLAFARE